MPGASGAMPHVVASLTKTSLPLGGEICGAKRMCELCACAFPLGVSLREFAGGEPVRDAAMPVIHSSIISQHQSGAKLEKGYIQYVQVANAWAKP